MSLIKNIEPLIDADRAGSEQKIHALRTTITIDKKGSLYDELLKEKIVIENKEEQQKVDDYWETQLKDE